ncbi:uncharacterized protein LOC107266828 isoform X1 [Cephus cinctus]|uniref:Uncharacterized protein LOC107266828 isoform X1 n=1 Tax=Cephus cinctus TaxID=211228 RepID=A0AAJ7BSD3_CEPCN|nr:uncharacterized protein LOC107266828 isoform X1 [Cephus cinctus]
MLMLRALGVLLSIATIRAAPLASVHVKFVSPPHTYEHGLTTHDGNTIAQKSYLSVGRRNLSKDQHGTVLLSKNLEQTEYTGRRTGRILRGRVIKPENAESLWPIGVFIPPVDTNDLGYSSQDAAGHMTPDFSNGLEHPDPFLLTGEEAALAVKLIYGRGELFWDNYPHVRALLRNQEERIRNGLQGHILSSLRPDSPFYRSVQ